jgi:uncharacterized damage-inducible protein DinB
MTSKTLAALVAYDVWANRELLGAVAALDADKYQTELHTAIRTLNHIYVVKEIFRAHLLGLAHGYSATNTAETPTLVALSSAFAASDAWHQHYVETLDEKLADEALHFRFTDGDVGTMTREEMVLHVLHHSGYHRGNVGQIMKGIGIAPPRDLFTRFLRTSEPDRRRQL